MLGKEGDMETIYYTVLVMLWLFSFMLEAAGL